MFRRLLFLLLLFVGQPALAQEESVPQSREEIQLSFAPLVKAVTPAVVNVYTAAPGGFNPFFDDPVLRELFGDSFGDGPGPEMLQNSLGSGVIVSADGLVVTNHHVIKGASEITVILSDQREYPAQVVLDDERTDLAILRIDPAGEQLPFLELGDSDQLQVGDLVLAIGNPFGVGQTVTMGIVSALARTQVGIGDYSFFIQTDAAINPGNSGGALISLDGRLIGINSAIYSRSGGSIGIGFAIPANMVRTVVHSAETGQPIVRPWPGLQVENVTAELAQALGRDRPGGVVVSRIFPDGPADRAGLAPGDLILSVGGQPVQDKDGLAFRLATLGLGETAELLVLRDSLEHRFDLPLEAAPENPPRDLTTLEGRQPLAGATVANLSPALSEELGLEGAWSGVIILRVERGTPARKFRLRPGDVILTINKVEVESARHLAELLAAAPSWSIELERQGEVLTLDVRP